MTLEDVIQQLEAAQTQLAFQEDVIQSLNEIVTTQSVDIQSLIRKVELLSSRFHNLSQIVGEADAETDQKPPHY
jgi:SlyX protein